MIFDSGITAAALTAVLLNIVFNIVGRSGDSEAPIFAEAPPPASISDDDEARLVAEGRAGGAERDYRHDAGQAHTGSVWESRHSDNAREKRSSSPTRPEEPSRESDHE